jgi:hypothetical protein
MLNRLQIAGWVAMGLSVVAFLVNMSQKLLSGPMFLTIFVLHALLFFAGTQLWQRRRWAWWYIVGFSLVGIMLFLTQLKLLSPFTIIFALAWIALLALLIAEPPSRWAKR